MAHRGLAWITACQVVRSCSYAGQTPIFAGPTPIFDQVRSQRAENLAYYDVPAKTRVNYGLAYLALAAYLAVMTGEVHEMLEAAGVRGRL